MQSIAGLISLNIMLWYHPACVLIPFPHSAHTYKMSKA